MCFSLMYIYYLKFTALFLATLQLEATGKLLCEDTEGKELPGLWRDRVSGTQLLS